MSYSIIYAGRVRIQDNKVLFQTASQDNNVCPQPGKGFGTRDKDFYTHTNTFRVDDHEGIAQYAESLARSYDGGCMKERSRYHDGPAAYKLWATRVKKGTGIVLRKPRLSEVFYNHVPANITGRPCKVTPIAKGSVIAYEKARELIEAGVRFQASFTNGGYISTGDCVRFGFISKGDQVCFYKPRSARRGYPIGPNTVITLSEDIGPDTSYGDVVPVETVAGIENGDDLRFCLRTDVFVIVDQKMKILCGMKGSETKPHEHALMSFANIYSWYLPSFFNRENAGLMVERMTKFMPERKWQAITLAQLAAHVLGLALAA